MKLISGILLLLGMGRLASCGGNRFEDLDLDKNNAISYEEFEYNVAQLPEIKEAFRNQPDWKEALKILFETFDKDLNKELNKS